MWTDVDGRGRMRMGADVLLRLRPSTSVSRGCTWKDADGRGRTWMHVDERGRARMDQDRLGRPRPSASIPGDIFPGIASSGRIWKRLASATSQGRLRVDASASGPTYVLPASIPETSPATIEPLGPYNPDTDKSELIQLLGKA